jgi:hypothetical protein
VGVGGASVRRGGGGGGGGAGGLLNLVVSVFQDVCTVKGTDSVCDLVTE